MSSSESSSSSHSGSGSSGFGFSASAPHKASPTPPPLRITTTSLMPQAPQLNNSNPDAVAIDNVFLSSPALNSANMIFGDTKSANSSDNSKTNLAFLSPRMSRGPNAPPKSADSRGSTPSLFRLMKKSGKGADKKHNSQMEISVENEHPLKSGYSNNSLPRKYLSSSHSSFEQKSVNSLRAFGDVQRSSHKKIISMPTKNNNHR